MKILVVDDTRIILSVIEAILTQEHQDIITASDGRAGLRAFLEHRPDMIITDIEMPWQDGLSMMASIRRTQPGVLTLYMTGNPGPYQQRLNEEADAFGVGLLLKPFTRSELIQSMGAVANREASSREPCDSLTPRAAIGPPSSHTAMHDWAALSAADFQRETRYEKMYRPIADRHRLDGILAGGRG